MESFQSIVLAECVQRERLERAARNATIDSALGTATVGTTPRETMAGVLIALARWMVPRHAALRMQVQ